jgi:hypothetical protein
MAGRMRALAVVTSSSGYGRYFQEWARSIAAQGAPPGEVCIFTHGTPEDAAQAAAAERLLASAGIRVTRAHEAARLDFGTARNRAVALSSSPWVMHLDVDDMLLPHALADAAALAEGADVIAFGYERCGDLAAGPSNRRRLYRDLQGPQVLAAQAPCSGVSPFRRALWERSPYRTDMLGAWDTALWIGFGHLGIRIRATTRPVFLYRQHADSIFNKRRKAQDWSRAHTAAMLGTLRRNAQGVSVLVPLGSPDQRDRLAAWAKVRDVYRSRFPGWQVVEGRAPVGAWCKGAAIAAALDQATGATLVIADADCLIAPEALAEAVRRVEHGEVPWAVPHQNVCRLDRATTARMLQLPEGSIPLALERPAYPGYPGGGILVVPRVGYLACGGFPMSFIGWGSEDQALALILDTCLGTHWRGSADLWHLWHPPQDRRAARSRNHAKLRTLRALAPQGRDALVGYLRRGAVAEARLPTWKQKGIELAAQRREQAIAAGKFIPSAEPHWIRQAKAAKARRAAQRKRDLGGGG